MSNFIKVLLNILITIASVFWDFITYVLGIFWNFIKAIPKFFVNTWDKIDNTSINNEPIIISLKGNNCIAFLIIFVCLLLVMSFFLSVVIKYKNEK